MQQGERIGVGTWPLTTVFWAAQLALGVVASIGLSWWTWIPVIVLSVAATLAWWKCSVQRSWWRIAAAGFFLAGLTTMFVGFLSMFQEVGVSNVEVGKGTYDGTCGRLIDSSPSVEVTKSSGSPGFWYRSDSGVGRACEVKMELQRDASAAAWVGGMLLLVRAGAHGLQRNPSTDR